MASATIADALVKLHVPAVVAVQNGGHAISVYGVQTDVAPVANQDYTITGFFVHDPWTGWAVSQNYNGWKGLGYNTFLRYGRDDDPSATYTILPNGQQVFNTVAPWNRQFTVAPGQITPNLAWTAPRI